MKQIKKEQIEHLYPQNYNKATLKDYSLVDLQINKSFCYYYSCYRFYLDEYLKDVLNLEEINNKIKELNIGKNISTIYKDISNLDLEYVFIRNNIFLDRLSSAEFLKLRVIYENADPRDLTEFVKSTYQKLIVFDNNYELNTPIKYGNYQSFNNALVIALSCNPTQEFVTYLQTKAAYYKNLLNIPVSIFIYNSSEEIDREIIFLENLNAEYERKEKEELKKYPKYLPLGSIVLLKNGWKKVMVIGYCPIDMDSKEKVYDYLGCLYPEGVIRTDFNIAFNHDDLKKICVLGLQDEEQKNFNQKLQALTQTNIL